MDVVAIFSYKTATVGGHLRTEKEVKQKKTKNIKKAQITCRLLLIYIYVINICLLVYVKLAWIERVLAKILPKEQNETKMRKKRVWKRKCRYTHRPNYENASI